MRKEIKNWSYHYWDINHFNAVHGVPFLRNCLRFVVCQYPNNFPGVKLTPDYITKASSIFNYFLRNIIFRQYNTTSIIMMFLGSLISTIGIYKTRVEISVVKNHLLGNIYKNLLQQSSIFFFDYNASVFIPTIVSMIATNDLDQIVIHSRLKKRNCRFNFLRVVRVFPHKNYAVTFLRILLSKSIPLRRTSVLIHCYLIHFSLYINRYLYANYMILETT